MYRNGNKTMTGLWGFLRNTGAVVFRLVLVSSILSAGGAAIAAERPLSKAWDEALAPIRSMPVQDFGFVRSGYTFGENHLLAISDQRSLEGLDALESVMWLMSRPEAARDAQLIKIERPQLVHMFSSKRISLAQYRSPAVHEQMMQLIRQNQEEWMGPVNDLEGKAQHLEELENDFAIIPRKKEWLAPSQLGAGSGEVSEAVRALDVKIAEQWEKLRDAIKADDPAAGREAATQLALGVAASAKEQGIVLPKLELDVFYHRHHPFAKSAFFYLFAALLYGASLLFARRWAGWIGFALLIVGLVEQVIGVTARWMLAGRAPLSNMYESFTFAIGGMILVALVFELFSRTRLAGLGGAVLGFIFMVLAHKAPIFDTQIRPLMPALQSSWLTYHVVTIMLSYSAFALSFFVGIAYLIKDAAGGDQSRMLLMRQLPNLEAMDVFNYKIIAVGFPLLTIGVVFGAVWAATAWGRPWGFDPKETWSAITWLIYAIYLHVRYLAGWKGRRAAILSLVGFAGVLFTYLGVNYLLPGLHSYV
ncbi:MAG: c-type cytochrome biogenesis protein CcsB [bacterium]